MVNTFRVKQDTAAIYTATLKDETGAAIPLASLTAITLTLFNADVPEPSPLTANIINGRNEQDVKNTNNVTIHATSGLLTWNMQSADNPIIDERFNTELHIARFDFFYGSPTKQGAHEVRFRVENLRKVSS